MSAFLHEDWDVLLGLFPAGWEELGRSTGAVARLRGFDSLNDVFRTLLLHVGCGWSLRETAVQAKLAGIADVSDVTLLNRLRQSEEWLLQLCQRLWQDNGVNLEPALKGQPVRLVDATVVKEPGKTGGQWRIHYSMRLPSLERCKEIILSSPLCRARIPVNDWGDSRFTPANWCWPTRAIAPRRGRGGGGARRGPVRAAESVGPAVGG